MIVRISKVEIAGPKDRLEKVLARLQDAGIFQIEKRAVGFVKPGDEYRIRSLMPESSSVVERLLLEGLRSDIDELLGYMVEVEVRESYLEPSQVLDTLAGTVKRHIEDCREKAKLKETLRKELEGLDRYSRFDPSRDGGRFLAAQRADFDAEADKHDQVQGVVLVENWASEFRQKQDK